MDDDGRIPTDVWVAAQVRALGIRNMPAYLAHKGGSNGGLVLVKLLARDRSCTVFSQSRDFDGKMGWLPALDGAKVDEREADAYIGRAVSRDPDLWVLEVETPDGAMPFEGKIF